MTAEQCLREMAQCLDRTAPDEMAPAPPRLAPVRGARPRVSVVIPVFNRVAYFHQCLASVMEQWTDDLEVLVADDCSDVPVTVDDARVTVHRNPQRLGQWPNVNAALGRTRGEWIHLLHDDDHVENGFYAAFRRSLRRAPAEVGMACGSYRLHAPELAGNYLERPPLRAGAGPLKPFLPQLSWQNPLTVPAVLMKREVFESVGVFVEDLEFCADWELYLRATTRFAWWYEPAAIAWHREHADSVTGQTGLTGEDAVAVRRTVQRAAGYLPPEIVAASAVYNSHRFIEGARLAFSKSNFSLACRLLEQAVLLGMRGAAERALRQMALRPQVLPRYDDPELSRLPLDVQGWRHHPLFAELVRELRPAVTVVMGAGKGGAALEMARAMRQAVVPGDILCVGGDARQVRANVVHEGLQDYVLPVPAAFLETLSGLVDLVYLADGDASPLWSLLRPGGVLFGGGAVEQFASERALVPRRHGEMWVLQKEATSC